MPRTPPRTLPHRPAGALLLTAVLLGLPGGCGVTRAPAVPAALADDAVIPGFEDVRGWGEEFSAHLGASLRRSFEQEREEDVPVNAAGDRIHDVLILSAGGGDGAYGAGVLCGWSACADRPAFKIVCGVSTGALIAPFAFLGPGHDPALRALYTGVSREDIADDRSLLAAAFGDSLADTTPLRRLIAEYVDAPLLEEIARAHERGRRLYVATTNLDAQRLVVWDMGLIAIRRTPRALELFRDVLLASASVPVEFPPVYLPVEAGGRPWSEMHVDGGLRTYVFLPLASLTDHTTRQRLAGRRFSLHVIRNGYVRWQHRAIAPELGDIAFRSVETLTNTLAVEEIRSLYVIARAGGAEFHIASIPDDAPPVSEEDFDQREMRRLFDLGCRLGTERRAWLPAPPQWVLDGAGPALWELLDRVDPRAGLGRPLKK